MSSTTMSKLVQRTSTRQIIPSSTRLTPIRRFIIPTASISTSPRLRHSPLKHPIKSTVHARSFSASRPNPKGLSPESENPPIKETEDEPTATATDISEETYHEAADVYINALMEKLEELQEESEDVDVEYSAGVLTLAFPPNGTYVINKQPPNKQIWLSSPITGPKRYDYVVMSEGQDAKEGTGRGEWVYLRDGSTLTDLLQSEVGVDMTESYIPDESKVD